jgi:hypothetical protein
VVCQHTSTHVKYLFPAIYEVFKENSELWAIFIYLWRRKHVRWKNCLWL